MSKLRKTAVALGFVAALLAWATNYKVPEGFEEPWKLKFLFTAVQTIGKTGNFLGWLYDDNMYIMQLKRKMTAMKPAPVPSTISTEDIEIDGVKCRLYKPKNMDKELLPTIIYFHGGGWCVGDIDSFQNVTGQLSVDLKAIVISVEYRLAPEHLYPAGIDDCYSVVKHVLTHHKKYGTDPKRVAVAGDSAGGNLAAAVSLRLRDEKVTPNLKAQILMYPALQPWDFQMTSYVDNKYDALLPPSSMAEFWNTYSLGNNKYVDDIVNNRVVSQSAMEEFHKLCGKSTLLSKYQPANRPTNLQAWSELERFYFYRDPYFTPFAAKSFADLPPAIVLTMEQDILRDEGMIYAELLKAGKNTVIHRHLNSGFHGLISCGHLLSHDFWKAYNMIIDDIRNVLK